VSAHSERNVAGRGQRGVAIAALLLLAWTSPAAHGADALTLEATIPLDHVTGRIDHMAFDPGRKRLIVAELGNDSVDVIDVVARSVVHRIDGLKEPQGVAYAATGDRIAVANAGDGTVRLFRADTFASAGSIALGEDADDLRIDPADGRLVVGYGQGAIAWIDPARAEKSSEIPLAAHPEAFELHPTNGRIFVNVPEARQIAVLDRRSRRQIATWDVGARRSNFPMAFAGDGSALYVVFRNPAHLVLFDPERGSVMGETETCGDADDVFFDAKRRRIYVSCGAGAVDIFGRQPDGIRRLGRIKTSSGARTSLFVPELDRLYVAQRAGLIGRGAAILVFRPAS
jgi:YVTN family beta-propeller protein